MSEERLTVQRWNDSVVTPLNAMLSNPALFPGETIFNPAGHGSLLGFTPGAAHTLGNIIRLAPVAKAPGDRLTRQDIILINKILTAYQRDLAGADVFFDDPIRLTKQRIDDYVERISWGLDFFETASGVFMPGSTYWTISTNFIKFGAYLFDSYLGIGSPNARQYNLLLGVTYDGAPFEVNFGFNGSIVNNVIQGHTNTDEWDVTAGVNPPISAGINISYMPYLDPDATTDLATSFPQATSFSTFEADLPALVTTDDVELLTLPY